MKISTITRWITTFILTMLLSSTIGARSVAAANPDSGSNDVTVSIQRGADLNGILSYTITAQNMGGEVAKWTEITIPFDAAALRVVDAQFNTPNGWVVTNESGKIVVSTGRLASGGGSVETTLRFIPLPDHQGAFLTKQLSYQSDGHRVRLSNHPNSADSAPILDSANLTMTTTERGFMIHGANFTSEQPIFFWLNAPNGSVIQLRIDHGELITSSHAQDRADHDDRTVASVSAEYANANADGSFSFTMLRSDLMVGTYTLVANDRESDTTYVRTFQVS